MKDTTIELIKTQIKQANIDAILEMQITGNEDYLTGSRHAFNKCLKIIEKIKEQELARSLEVNKLKKKS